MNPEQLRPMLFIALAFVLFLMWQEWQLDYGPKPPPAQTPTQESVATASGDSPPVVPQASQTNEVPVTPISSATTAQASSTPETPTTVEPAASIVTVTTDVIRVRIDTAGGTLRQLELLQYPASSGEEDTGPFLLPNDQLPDLFMAQSGLLGEDAPNHTATMMAAKSEYQLKDGEDAVEVVLNWRSEKGIEVRKVFEFRRGQYQLNVRYEVENKSNAPWAARMYGQFKRTQVVQEGGIGLIYTYTGGVISSEEKPYDKVDFADMADADVAREHKGGWVAMIQHYFAGAWIPNPDTSNYYYSKAEPGSPYLLGTMSPNKMVAAGATGNYSMGAYIGPKIQDLMSEAAPNLDRTVDYGWLWMIAQPLFLGLSLIHSFLGNWGWSIITLTLLIKLAFFHLSATSYKSMARMRKLQPKMVQLRERHGDDRQKMNQAMMELYKTEKINPLSGCLPILVQIPVFIALYWTLLESVELRHAPFMFWLTDLATHDPYFVLPVLMGLSMLIQQRLNPAPPDPIQAKVMMALPFVFTFFFLWFPSGLVLYWVVNNILSIAQQWVITKRIEAAP